MLLLKGRIWSDSLQSLRYGSCSFYLEGLFYISVSFSLLQVKKHIKQGPGHEGGIFTVEAPLHASNVQVLDPVTGYWLNSELYILKDSCCFSLLVCNKYGFFFVGLLIDAGDLVRLDINI